MGESIVRPYLIRQRLTSVESQELFDQGHFFSGVEYNLLEKTNEPVPTLLGKVKARLNAFEEEAPSEIRSYAQEPAFILGVFANVCLSVDEGDPQ
jgi:hypothetical protein